MKSIDYMLTSDIFLLIIKELNIYNMLVIFNK